MGSVRNMEERRRMAARCHTESGATGWSTGQFFLFGLFTIFLLLLVALHAEGEFRSFPSHSLLSALRVV